jgi:aryl-alcohol dehydrogenase-like predicted oxidoreductase
LELGVTPWSVLGAGILTGKYSALGTSDTISDDVRLKGRTRGTGSLTDRNLAIADEVVRIAQELGRAPSQIALAWVRQQPGTIIPLIGARTADQLRTNLECLDVTLTEDHLHSLTEISSFEPGFPHDFLASDHIRKIVYSDVVDRIDARGI